MSAVLPIRMLFRSPCTTIDHHRCFGLISAREKQSEPDLGHRIAQEEELHDTCETGCWGVGKMPPLLGVDWQPGVWVLEEATVV